MYEPQLDSSKIKHYYVFPNSLDVYILDVYKCLVIVKAKLAKIF